METIGTCGKTIEETWDISELNGGVKELITGDEIAIPSLQW